MVFPKNCSLFVSKSLDDYHPQTAYLQIASIHLVGQSECRLLRMSVCVCARAFVCNSLGKSLYLHECAVKTTCHLRERPRLWLRCSPVMPDGSIAVRHFRTLFLCACVCESVCACVCLCVGARACVNSPPTPKSPPCRHSSLVL